MVKCEICGIGDAKYVCSKCGRRVCGECFNIQFWMCRECMGKSYPTYVEGWRVADTLMKTFTIGFIVILIGIILIMLSQIMIGGAFGGIIIFPFIPIIFFQKLEGATAILFTLLMMIAMIIIIVIWMYLTRKILT
ncbi:MAG: hypothetical protein LM601_05810 [Candidatus Verstraetearchaeota archaeon]|nr:hypothetical protein [Candidatus Verstraetearchaeota archaeon]